MPDTTSTGVAAGNEQICAKYGTPQSPKKGTKEPYIVAPMRRMGQERLLVAMAGRGFSPIL